MNRPALSMRFQCAIGVILVAATLCCHSASASIIGVTSRSGLGGDDFVDWGQLGPTDFNPINVPFDVTSNSGLVVTLSKITGFI